jgi:tryptophanyl-tRNA synthetase
MDLADPDTKMGKSHVDGSGIIYLLDSPDVVRRKVARAVTDSETGAEAIRRDRMTKPGVTNLIELLEACGGSVADIVSYGALKAAVTEAVVELLRPLQTNYVALAQDPAQVDTVYAAGAQRCREVTAAVLDAARQAMGLR